MRPLSLFKRNIRHYNHLNINNTRKREEWVVVNGIESNHNVFYFKCSDATVSSIQESVAGTQAIVSSGYIGRVYFTASPNPCTVTPTSSVCTSYITWDATSWIKDITNAKVSVREINPDGSVGPETIFSTSTSCQNVNCPASIRLGSRYYFELKNYSPGSEGDVIATMYITARQGLICNLTWYGPIEYYGRTGIRKIGDPSDVEIDIKGLTANGEFSLTNSNNNNGLTVTRRGTYADANGNFFLARDTTPIKGDEYNAGRYSTSVKDISTNKSASCTPSFVIGTQALIPTGQYSASILENIKATLDQIQKAINGLY